MMRTYDIAVIGAGVVGTAIARRLAATRCSVAILDARDDVTEGTSKANTAILHTGYDAKPGTLEGRLVARGYRLTWQYCKQAGIGVRRTGAVLVAWDEEQAASLPALQAKAVQNGYEKTRIITPEQVYAELPHLGPGVTGGLTVPDESIIDAWSVPLGFATDAVNRGAALLREHRVEGIEVGADVTRIRTSAGALKARWVVNAAGLGSDAIDAMYGYDRLRVNPRRGELLVFDKLASGLAPKIVLAAPSKVGKGVLISPTIFGNVMLGPTAEDMEDKTDTATTEAGFAFLLEKGERAHRPRAPRRGGDRLLRRPASRQQPVRLPHRGGQAPALRDRLRHPLHRPDLGHCGRRAHCGADGRGEQRPGHDRTSRPAPGGAHGAARRAPAAPLQGRRADRRGPGIRHHGLLLRAGHPRRDPRRHVVHHPAVLAVGSATAHPGDERALPGFLLRS